jgi:hypothetical protein
MPTCANWVKWVLINMLYNKCIQEKLIRKTDQPDKPVFGDIIISIVISDLSRQHCLFGDSHVGSSLLIF